MNIKNFLRFALLGAFALTMLIALGSARPAQARTDSPEGTAMQADEPDGKYILDHFWCYQLNPAPPVNQAVLLQDQFYTQPIQVQVNNPARLCNPAKKKHGDLVYPINNPNDHLVMYSITPPPNDVTFKVEVKNQFGVRQLKVFTPAVVLAVPSTKLPDPPQSGLTDHYKCYRVKGQAFDQLFVGLRDQFRRGQVQVFRPYILCNPVIKTHNNVVTPIQHPKAHLVCYRVTEKEFPADRQILNQFVGAGPVELHTTKSDLLCLPSKKRIITP